MILSKKKFTFERKKNENKENDYNKQNIENETKIKIKNKYSPDKNLFLDESPIKEEKNLKPLLKEKEVKESPKFSQNQVNSDNLEQKIFLNNPGIQYLINQNQDENIDFINTLLKLKGIQLNHLKNCHSKENLSVNSNIIEANNFIPKLKKKVIIRNKKCNQSNSSNLTTKINSLNNNQQNENDEEEISKNLENKDNSRKEINNNVNEATNDRLKFNENENNNTTIDINLFKGKLLTLSNNEKDEHIEKNNDKNESEINLKKELSLKDKNKQNTKKFDNQNNLLISNEKIKTQEKICFNLNINEKINKKLLKKMNYTKIPKSMERLCLSKKNQDSNDNNLDTPETNKERKESNKSSKKIVFIKNIHQNHTINNASNNNINIKKPKIDRKIVKRQKSMNSNIKNENKLTVRNNTKLIQNNEFLENKSSNNIMLTNYTIRKNRTNNNLYKQINTEFKNDKDNLTNLKKFDKIIQKKNNKILKQKLNLKDENKNVCEFKEYKNNCFGKIHISQQNMRNKATNIDNSYDKFVPHFSVDSGKKIKIFFPKKENYKNVLNISPNKRRNLTKRNSPKNRYDNYLNSYSKIATNKMLISPSHKKDVINNINNINNLMNDDFYERKRDIAINSLYNANNEGKNYLSKLLDKNKNLSKSKISKKLVDKINNSIEKDKDEFNDESINEIKKTKKIKKSKRAEIFLYDID